MNMTNNVCIICRKKNTIRNEKLRVSNLLNELDMLTRIASKEQIKERDEYLRKNPYLRKLCNYNEKCSYGISCPEIRQTTSSINKINEEIVEKIILLSMINPEKTKTFIRSFQGYYPKMARYLLEQGT